VIPQTSFLWLHTASQQLDNAFWFSFQERCLDRTATGSSKHTTPHDCVFIARGLPVPIGSGRAQRRQNSLLRLLLAGSSAWDRQAAPKSCCESLYQCERRSWPVGIHIFCETSLPTRQKASSSPGALGPRLPKRRLHHCLVLVKGLCRLGLIPTTIAVSLEHGILQDAFSLDHGTPRLGKRTCLFPTFVEPPNSTFLLRIPSSRSHSSLQVTQGPY
jgi:hypothetical protein